jgi:hypothetical protein
MYLGMYGTWKCCNCGLCANDAYDFKMLWWTFRLDPVLYNAKTNNLISDLCMLAPGMWLLVKFPNSETYFRIRTRLRIVTFPELNWLEQCKSKWKKAWFVTFVQYWKGSLSSEPHISVQAFLGHLDCEVKCISSITYYGFENKLTWN